MNIVFLLMVVIAYICAAWQQLMNTSIEIAPMDQLTQVVFSASNDAIALAIGLIGIMAFFLGLMKVAEEAGLLNFLAKLLSPMLSRLFPDVPHHHEAHGAIVMNVSANMLGLGNAATPFGIKAMKALDSINQNPGVATNAMIMFLAINTSSVTLIPTKVIALRAAAGSDDPSIIIMSTLFATLISTMVAISLALLFQRIKGGARSNNYAPFTVTSVIGLVIFLSLLPISFMYGKTLAPWIVPSMTVLILAYGYLKKVNVYEQFCEGAKEGFWVAVKIMPYLVAILAAIGLLKASGALPAFIDWISPVTSMIGLPGEALPMAFMRPLSGSGSLGVLTDILQEAGPDSYLGLLVSTMMGSTETTFYVIAVYFGAVQIQKLRHTLWVALSADLAGILASVVVVRALFG